MTISDEFTPTREDGDQAYYAALSIAFDGFADLSREDQAKIVADAKLAYEKDDCTIPERKRSQRGCKE